MSSKVIIAMGIEGIEEAMPLSTLSLLYASQKGDQDSKLNKHVMSYNNMCCPILNDLCVYTILLKYYFIKYYLLKYY